LNKKTLMLAPSAIDDLMSYSWPGNVRELQNCIERAVILTDGDTIHARHLNLMFREAASAPVTDESPWARIDLSGTLAEASRRVLAEVERRKIQEAIGDSGGDRGRAAGILQMSYKTLVSKIRELGIE
jgi:DNA-binding NtrC family response regulator